MEQERPRRDSGEDFASFLAAVRAVEDSSPVRSTSHTSSVSTADWERVEEQIAKQGES